MNHANWFQFHIGSIKRGFGYLKFFADDEFQFHIGSIKRTAFCALCRTPRRFQFHIGSIKSLETCPLYEVADVGFNSTLVRLKDAAEKLRRAWRSSFNSTLVRLKDCLVDNLLAILLKEKVNHEFDSNGRKRTKRPV